MGRTIEGLIEELDLNSIEGLEVEVGGIWFAELRPPESEAIGLAFAVFVLIAVLGSVMAMGATVAAALVTVGIGATSIIVFSNFMTVPDFAPAIGLMIGLGVGIDYALFIITRYRDALGEGHGREQALVVALDSAGRSVIFAGATVVVSLLGMLFIGIPFVTGFGVAAAATVAVVMVGSVTLLPSLIALLGERITTTRVRGIIAAVLLSVALFGFGAGIEPLLGALPVAVIVLVAGMFGRDRNPLRRKLRPRRERPVRETGWYRLSRAVQARPWAFAIGGTLLLLLLAAPVLVLRFGFADESNYGPETTTRKAYDLLVEGFGAGANGPLVVVAEVSGPSQMTELNRLVQAMAATDGVSFVSPPIPNSPIAPTAAAIEVRPTTGPQAAETEALVKHLRSTVIPAATAGTDLDPVITGLVAVKADVSDFLKSRTAVFFVAVLGASFLLLMAVFRSLVVPLKAVIMNMLSIGAAYGVLVAVFQWGWFGGLIGIEPGPIEPFMPMMLFAVLFGLSMDYEVFLLSRMKEEYERTGDAVNSVADGLAATAQSHHRGRIDHGVRVRQLRARGPARHQDVRSGPRRRRRGRRQPGAHAHRAVHHGTARGPQLVAARLARPDPAQPQRGGQSAGPGSGGRSREVGVSGTRPLRGLSDAGEVPLGDHAVDALDLVHYLGHLEIGRAAQVGVGDVAGQA